MMAGRISRIKDQGSRIKGKGARKEEREKRREERGKRRGQGANGRGRGQKSGQSTIINHQFKIGGSPINRDPPKADKSPLHGTGGQVRSAPTSPCPFYGALYKRN